MFVFHTNILFTNSNVNTEWNKLVDQFRNGIICKVLIIKVFQRRLEPLYHKFGDAHLTTALKCQSGRRGVFIYPWDYE